jgi:hypothetical protein
MGNRTFVVAFVSLGWLGYVSATPALTGSTTEPASSGFQHETVPSARNEPFREVDRAYRQLEVALRPHGCVSCHAADAPANDNPVELFRHPGQALRSRHTIVRILEENAMPPVGVDGLPGISNPAERAKLLALARAFEIAADDALAREGPLTTE